MGAMFFQQLSYHANAETSDAPASLLLMRNENALSATKLSNLNMQLGPNPFEIQTKDL
jgi:hypothetical protein